MHNLTQLALVVRFILNSKDTKKHIRFLLQTDITTECPTAILFAQQLTHIELVGDIQLST